MTESAVRIGDAGELFLSGVLDYRTGPDLRKQGQEHPIEVVGKQLRGMMPWISAGKPKVADASGGAQD